MKIRARSILEDASFRFTLPVITENILTMAVGLVYSSVLGGVSVSSLAAANTGNQMMNVIIAVFSAVTTGSAIMISRLTGKNDVKQASRVVEHTMLLAPAVSAIVMLLMLLISSPVMRLLMPGANPDFLNEGLSYMRAVLLSLPALITYNALSGMLRAAGDSKSALYGAVITNAVQLLSAWFFINTLHMEIRGAGYAYVVCRYAGALFMYYAILRHHRSFVVNTKNLFHPTIGEWVHIMKVGLPSTIDSLAVQSGYLLINTLLIGLGQQQASVYSVLATLVTLTGICQGIVSATTTTLVGHKVGAGQIEEGKRLQLRLMLIAFAFTTVLCAIVMVFPRFFMGLFTNDAGILEESASLTYVLIMFCLPAVGVNSTEPGARVGGEAKLVMFSCILNVWLVRLPLTWLFCYPMNMGVLGVFLANSIACTARAILGYLMIQKKSWGVRAL